MQQQKNNTGLYWACGILLVGTLVAFGVKTKLPSQPVKQAAPIVQQQTPLPPAPAPVQPKAPAIPKISLKVPAYLDYSQTVAQLKKWNQEAPDLTEVGVYGKTKRGTDIHYIRITNKFNTAKKPVVLITACIHGNEPWSSGCVMAYAGTLLGEYGTNKEITELVNTRDIYIVPVVSPDSYPHSRHVDGVDPNRDFPGPSRPSHTSTPSIQAVQNFFNKIRPSAVISGHTHGRIFLTPFGDKMQVCPNEADYKRIVGEMGVKSQYRVDRACNMYGRPIHGSEVDWYYRNGAFSIVMEFGTHQRKPSQQEITSEFQRTWSSVLLFIREAPLVQVRPGLAFDSSGSKNIVHTHRSLLLTGLAPLIR